MSIVVIFRNYILELQYPKVVLADEESEPHDAYPFGKITTQDMERYSFESCFLSDNVKTLFIQVVYE